MTTFTLPSGRTITGRSLRRAPAQSPDWGLYLTPRHPEDLGWPLRWVRWRDFWVPSDTPDARDALAEAWRRSATERVEIACVGGVGRTGTALAGITLLDGISAGRPLTVDEAVQRVRSGYHRRAVETPWQRAWLARLAAQVG